MEILLSALTSAIVLSLGLFIVKVFFKTTFERWIAHQFDSQFEVMKSALRKEEEQFKADLATQEKRLASLQVAALSGMTARNQVLDKRRIEALEQLWRGVIELRPLRSAAQFTQSLNMDKVMAAAAAGDANAAKMKQFANDLWVGCGLEGYELPDTPDKERPFISPVVWSTFSAYRRIAAYPMAQLAAARTGLGKNILSDTAPLLELAKEVLPDYSGYVDQFGDASIPYLLEPLQNKLLTEIMSSLEGHALDEKTIARADDIQRAAERLGSRPKVTAPDQTLVASKTPPP